MILMAVGLCVLGGVLGGGLTAYLAGSPKPAVIGRQTEVGPKRVALYCQFYVFVESRPFVAFLLERSADDSGRYVQAYVAKADGDRTDYNALAEKRPEWRLEGAGEPAPRLRARVTVPDPGPAGLDEQDIAIELRDFDAARADGVWREASLKSVYYQNLPGKCRQIETREPDQRASG